MRGTLHCGASVFLRPSFNERRLGCGPARAPHGADPNGRGFTSGALQQFTRELFPAQLQIALDQVLVALVHERCDLLELHRVISIRREDPTDCIAQITALV